MDSVILAAGVGSRIRDLSHSKPLLTLGSKTMLERTMSGLAEAGVERFIVVVGYLAEQVGEVARQIAQKLEKPVAVVHNDKWEEANGVSVMAAKEKLSGHRFILSMCDHLFDPAIVKGLLDAPTGVSDQTTYLACDYRLDNPNVDLDDVTRVKLSDDYIQAIGKGLEEFHAYDCGLFNAHISLIEAIAISSERGGKSLSHGMEILASQKKCKAHDIKDFYWLDVDDKNAYQKARASLSGM